MKLIYDVEIPSKDRTTGRMTLGEFMESGKEIAEVILENEKSAYIEV